MCVLRVEGRDFDVNAFLKDSTLPTYDSYRRGEPPRLKSVRKRHPVHKKSGLKVGVSDREFSDLPGQMQDAIAFLKTHHDELARLRDFPGVEFVQLDFPNELRIDLIHVVVQYDDIPAELVAAAGELGMSLCLSLYSPCSDDRAASDK